MAIQEIDPKKIPSECFILIDRLNKELPGTDSPFSVLEQFLAGRYDNVFERVGVSLSSAEHRKLKYAVSAYFLDNGQYKQLEGLQELCSALKKSRLKIYGQFTDKQYAHGQKTEKPFGKAAEGRVPILKFAFEFLWYDNSLRFRQFHEQWGFSNHEKISLVFVLVSLLILIKMNEKMGDKLYFWLGEIFRFYKKEEDWFYNGLKSVLSKKSIKVAS